MCVYVCVVGGGGGGYMHVHCFTILYMNNNKSSHFYSVVPYKGEHIALYNINKNVKPQKWSL